MRIALLAVLLAGCSLCRAPARTAVPPGVEATAFIDQGTECVTVDWNLVERGLVAVLEIAANVTSIAADAHN